MDAIRIYRDGNAMAALVGPDLHQGEAEWVEIAPPRGPEQIRAAGEHALRRLVTRLPQHAITPVERDPIAD